MGWPDWLNTLIACVVAFWIAWGTHREAERRFDQDWATELADRADQQTAWLAQGDLRGIYGEYMPPAMFVESERVDVKPSNDGTPLLNRAAAMVKRAEYIEKHWGVVRASIDAEVSIEMLAIQQFLNRCSKREGMTYCQFVDYVRSSASYRDSRADGSIPLSALDHREMARAG